MFGKKKDTNSTPPAEEQEVTTRDPRKAHRFFDYAETVADSRNYDYAIECYINGLRHDPDNVEKHEALHEVALRRKVAGGKPAGLKEKLFNTGKSTIDKMLHEELLWAKDPTQLLSVLKVMKGAIQADAEEDELNFAELAYWVGSKALEMCRNAKNVKQAQLIELREMFRQIRAYSEAVEACRLALLQAPDNANLLQEIKDLEAERTMQDGKYADGGSFMDKVRDLKKQQSLDDEDTISKTDAQTRDVLERRRLAYEQDPSDLAAMQKYVDMLKVQETDEAEATAIEILKKAYAETEQYRYKAEIGNIKIRQAHRKLRGLKAKIDSEPGDAALVKKFNEFRDKILAFELSEYQDRVKNYPTDMRMRFELGKRLFALGKHDEAIGAFQQAKADPKLRAPSHEYLGRCYIAAGWLNEAIDTLKTGLEAHASSDDKLAMELRYLLMDAHEQLARRDKSINDAREAQTIASQILQTNINYRDIRDRVNAIRSLVAELQEDDAD